MKKTSRNLTKAERKIRNEKLLNDYELLTVAGVKSMDAQKILKDRYNIIGANTVGSIIYNSKKKMLN